MNKEIFNSLTDDIIINTVNLTGSTITKETSLWIYEMGYLD